MPDLINGVPLVWDDGEDLFGNLFKANNGNSLDSIKSKSPIGVEFPSLKGPFEIEDEFINYNIDFARLIYSLRDVNTLTYNYENYYVEDSGPEGLICHIKNVPLELRGRMNTQSGDVDPIPSSDFSLDVDKMEIRFLFLFYYKGTNRQKLAIELDVRNLLSFELLCDFLGISFPETKVLYAKSIFKKSFALVGNNGKQLNFLYKNAPFFILSDPDVISDAAKMSHLRPLLEYEKGTWYNFMTWFNDSTNAIINLLFGVNNKDKLYTHAYQNSGQVKEIYEAMSWEGRRDLCFLVDLLVKYWGSADVKKKQEIVTIYKGGKKDITCHFTNNKEDNILVTEREPDENKSITSENEYTVKIYHLYPLDLIQIHDLDTGEEEIISALALKYVTDKKDWEYIKKTAFITFSIVSIIMSGGMIAAGATGFMLTVLIADIAFETINLFMMSEETKGFIKQKIPGGDWLVDNWDAIYMVSIGGMWGTVLLQGALKNLPKIFLWLEKQGGRIISLGAELAKLSPQLRKYLTTVMASALMEINTINLVKGTLRPVSIEVVWVATNRALPRSTMLAMQEAGVIFVEGTLIEGKTLKGFAVLWKGEPIAEGTAKYVEDILKGFNGLKELKLLEALDNALLGMFKYGTTEMSKLAIMFRKTLGKNVRHNGNIAIFEYTDDTMKIVRKEFTTMSPEELMSNGLRKSPHAEIRGMKWLEDNKIPSDRVTKIYSELEPCSLAESMCKTKLTQTYKNAKVEFSFKYPGDDFTFAEIRREAIKERETILNQLIK